MTRSQQTQTNGLWLLNSLSWGIQFRIVDQSELAGQKLRSLSGKPSGRTPHPEIHACLVLETSSICCRELSRLSLNFAAPDGPPKSKSQKNWTAFKPRWSPPSSTSRGGQEKPPKTIAGTEAAWHENTAETLAYGLLDGSHVLYTGTSTWPDRGIPIVGHQDYVRSHDQEWFVQRRLSNLPSDSRARDGRGSIHSGRTDTRAARGKVHMRWHDGIRYARANFTK